MGSNMNLSFVRHLPLPMFFYDGAPPRDAGLKAHRIAIERGCQALLDAKRRKGLHLAQEPAQGTSDGKI